MPTARGSHEVVLETELLVHVVDEVVGVPVDHPGGPSEVAPGEAADGPQEVEPRPQRIDLVHVDGAGELEARK